MRPFTAFSLLLVICFGISPALNAQEQEHAIRIGYSNSNIIQDGANIGNNYNSFYFGYESRTPVAGKFAQIVGGLDYSRVGYYNNSDSYRQIQYIGVPVAFRVPFGPAFVQLGISGNFKINEQYKTDDSSLFGEEEPVAPVFDFPVQGGVGVTVGRFTIEGKYFYSLTPFEDGRTNAYFQIGGAFAF